MTVFRPTPACLVSFKASSAMRLIFDFDGTITTKDTISSLARSAVAFQQSRQGSQLNGQHLEKTWSRVEKAYQVEYEAFTAKYPLKTAQRTTIQDEIEYLAALKPVEEASLDRVSQSGVFKGLRRQDLNHLGRSLVSSEQVQLRKGFGDLIALAAKKKWSVDVLSVNWSTAFIEGIIHPVQVDRIVSNDVTFLDGHIQGSSVSNGLRMTCSSDKKAALQQLISPADDTEPEKELVVYFGDSTTDLECLLCGGMGIVLAQDDDSSLLKTLRRLDVRVAHVAEHTAHQEHKIYWARDFAEVLESGVLQW